MSEIKNIVSIDFHVHSPGSSCYNRNGKGEEEAYVDLLLKIAETDLQVVFITDHNSIKGYKKLIEIIKDNAKEIEIYQKAIRLIENSLVPDGMAKELEALGTIQKASDKVMLFPGIEFTTQDQSTHANSFR